LPQLLLYPFYSLLYPFRWYSFQIFFLIILYLLSLRNQKPACPSNLVFILAFCLFFFQFLLYTKT
jgi:predicted membrane protein